MKWLLLLMKRNFKRLSFIFTLCLIPAVVFAMNLVAEKDSDIIRIGYTCNGNAKSSTENIFRQLEQDDGMLAFISFDKEKDGMTALESAKIDMLWVFPEDLEKNISSFYSSGGSVVKVFNRVENEMSSLAREKLYCLMYPYTAYALFTDYMKNEIPGGDALKEEELRDYFNYKGIDSNIVEIVTVDSKGNLKEEKGNHIISPLRGIISVIVMLSGLAAAIYAHSDAKRGMFALFPPSKRLWIYYASVLSSLIPASLTALISIAAARLFEGIVFELTSMLAFILACASLSVFTAGMFNSAEKLGAAAVILVMTALIFSPVFLNTAEIPVIQALFPTYHYLYSITGTRNLIYLFIYAVVFFMVNILRSKICRKY